MESKTGDWICPINTCSNLNFAKRDHCNRCGATRNKDSLADTQRPRQAHYKDWICGHCGNANWSRRTHCNICKHSKSPSS